MKDWIAKWMRSEDAANARQFRGKTSFTRLRGYRTSERNQAKVMLVALVPALAIGPLLPKWSNASTTEKLVLSGVALWAAVVLIFGTVLAIRSIARAIDNRKQ